MADSLSRIIFKYLNYNPDGDVFIIIFKLKDQEKNIRNWVWKDDKKDFNIFLKVFSKNKQTEIINRNILLRVSAFITII